MGKEVLIEKSIQIEKFEMFSHLSKALFFRPQKPDNTTDLAPRITLTVPSIFTKISGPMQVLEHIPQLCCNPLRNIPLRYGPGEVSHSVSQPCSLHLIPDVGKSII